MLPELLTDFRNAVVTIENLTGEILSRSLSFDAGTPLPRTIEVDVGGQKLWSVQTNGGWVSARGLQLTLPPGKTELRFNTDVPAMPVG